MSITFQLANPWPGLNQLNEAVHDGLPDSDRSYECVPTSIASGLIFLTGRTYDGDEVRDAVYGANYVGGTAPSAYVAYCRAQGVDLVPFNGSQAALVSEIHSQLHQGHPVVITIPSQWGTPPPDPVHPVGWTHVGIMYGDGPGELELMNPWIWPQQHIGDDAYWAARLCFGQVWVMSKIGAPPPMAGTPQGWTDDGTTLKAPNGKTVTLGFRQYVRAADWQPDDQPEEEAVGLPSIELGNPSIGAGSRQIFTKRALGYTPSRNVYEMYTGQELLAWINHAQGLQQQLTAAQSAGQQATAQAQAAQQAEAAAKAAQAQAQQQLASAQAADAADQASVAKLTGQVNAAAAQLSAADAQIAQLQQQLAQLQANPPQSQPTPQDSAIAQAAEAMVSAVEAALAAAKTGN